MGNKQLFAKLGVFVLLSLNVAAYWFFWPNYRSGAMNASKAPSDKGETRLLPVPAVKDTAIPTPREISPATVNVAIPLNDPPSAPAQDKHGASAWPNKLQDLIKEQEKWLTKPRGDQPSAVPSVTTPIDQKKGATGIQENAAKRLDPQNQFQLPDPQAPKPLKIGEVVKPIKLPGEFEGATVPADQKVGVAALPVPKLPTSPWTVHQETRQNRTLLLARLVPPGSLTPIADFRIVCDRVETRQTQNELVALGNVLFTGGGMRGECQSVTLSLQDAWVLFEGQVQIADTLSAAQSFRSERVVWGPVSNATNQNGLVMPK